MKCYRSECNNETSNPKFCSRSCAATYNNTAFPKRKVESACSLCGKPCTTTRTYCKSCWKEVLANRSIEMWENCTLKDMKGVGNANAGGRYPYIRTLARRKYLQSDRPKACVVCGYSLHFDVAHVKDVQSFCETTAISEINNLNNLKALCKNHHWEFDHGLLSIPELGLVK
jgi:hypothetical protein